MTDTVSKEMRSRIMASVRGRDTKPELQMKRFLRGNGFSYQPKATGNPDFLNEKKRVAIFVDGCFWHGCPKCYSSPKSNKKFWRDKVQRNRRNDRNVAAELSRAGYRVIRVWEHTLKRNCGLVQKRIEAALGRAKQAYKKNAS